MVAVRRALIARLVGVLIGVAVGSVVFDSPLAGPTREDAEREVAKVGHPGHASCTPRDYPDDTWDCTALQLGTGGELIVPFTCDARWVVSVSHGRLRAVPDKRDW
jgi:hypothetical protein